MKNQIISQRLLKLFSLVLMGLIIIGSIYYIYYYAPLGGIKNLNRRVLSLCNQSLKDKKEVLCLFDENTKKLTVLPIEVNAIGYVLDAPLNQDNILKAINLKANFLPTLYPEMKEVQMYQFYSLKEIRPNNVLILSVNLPKILNSTLHNVEVGSDGKSQYQKIDPPKEPTSLCFAVEPLDPEKGNIRGQYFIYPDSLIFSKSTEDNNIFCTKLLKLEKYPILAYVNKLPKASENRNDYFGIKIWLAPSNLRNKQLTTSDFESNFSSFVPFYRYRVPFITNLIKNLKTSTEVK